MIALALALLPALSHAASYFYHKEKHLITLSVPVVPQSQQLFEDLKKKIENDHGVEWDAQFAPIEVVNTSGPGARWYQFLARMKRASLPGVASTSGVISIERTLASSLEASAMSREPQTILVVARMPDQALPAWLRMMESKYGSFKRLSPLSHGRHRYTHTGRLYPGEIMMLADQMWVISVTPYFPDLPMK